MKVGYDRLVGVRATSPFTGTSSESATSLTWELSAPRIGPPSLPSRVDDQKAPPGRRRYLPGRSSHGSADRARLRVGRPQSHGRGVCTGPRREARPGPARAGLRYHHGGAVGLARLAGGAWGDPCGHGEHRGLLEAGVLRAGGCLRLPARQRRAHQAGPGSEDGRAGLCVDRATAGARTAAGELRATSTDPRLA